MSSTKNNTGPVRRKPYDQISTDDNDDNQRNSRQVDDQNDELELTDRQIQQAFQIFKLFCRALKREARKRKWVRRMNFVNDRGQALCKLRYVLKNFFSGWVIGAALLIYKTSFFRQVWENPHKVFFFFDIAMIGLGINMSIMFYVSIYLPYFKKITEDFETYCPQVVPVMTIVGILTFFSFIVALWPVWGWLTPIFIFVMFMGYSMFMTFLPSGFLGTLIFWFLIFLMATFSHLLPHDPVFNE